MQFEAPYPVVTSLVIVPSPQFNNSQALTARVQKHHARDATLYTYVTKPGLRRFTWDFDLTRMKHLEVVEFVRLYAEAQWRVTDHEGKKIIGYLVSNPLVGTANRRALTCVTAGVGSRENVSLTIEFEGKYQA